MSEATQPVQPAPQPTPKQAKRKKTPARRKRAIRRVFRVFFLILLLGVGALLGWRYYQRVQNKAATAETPQYAQAFVREGEMNVTIYGSGAIAAASQPAVYADTEGTLDDLRVGIGDTVTAGQILAVMTNDTLTEEIASLEYDLWELDKTITNTASGSAVEHIKSPAQGRIKQINAAKGDDALSVYRRMGSVAMLSTDGRMKVSMSVPEGVPLNYNDTVTVTGADFSEQGTVTDLYLQGTQAVITVTNDRLPLDAQVTVTTQDGVTVGTGTLQINKPMAVSAFGGTIAGVRVEVGDLMYRGQPMFDLIDSPLSLTVENLRIQRETSAESLKAAREKRESLIVRAPVAGVIASIDATEGSELADGAQICSILEGEEMVLTIAVDELDVVKVAEGQPVTISVDALPDVLLNGTVSKIAPVGTSSSGVSTYEVKLNFDSAGTGVRPGMNASGEVRVAHADETLYIPVEALRTMGNKSFVMVADASSLPQGAALGGERRMMTFSGNGTPPEGAMTFSADGTPTGGQGQQRRRRSENAESTTQTTAGEPTAATTSTQVGGAQPDGAQRTTRGQSAQDGAQTTSGQQPTLRTQDAANATADAAPESSESTHPILAFLTDAWAKIRATAEALLDDGSNEAAAQTQITGTLREVTTGLVNDDSIQILSGVEAGEVVLYTGTTSSGGSGGNQMMIRGASMPMMF